MDVCDLFPHDGHPVPGYDVCIVGGGIAGMFCAMQLKQADSRTRVALVERDAELGGRIRSRYDAQGNLEVETGPWRVDAQHATVISLAKSLGLTLISAPSEASGKINLTAPAPPDATTAYDGMDPASMSTWGAEAFQNGVSAANEAGYRTGYGPELNFEARGGNAYQASGTDESYYVIKEGMSALVKGIEARYAALGVDVYTNHRVTDVRVEPAGYTVTSSVREADGSYSQVDFECARCCLALPPSFTTSFDIYRHLKPSASQVGSLPLVHVYAPINTKVVRVDRGFPRHPPRTGRTSDQFKRKRPPRPDSGGLYRWRERKRHPTKGVERPPGVAELSQKRVDDGFEKVPRTAKVPPVRVVGGKSDGDNSGLLLARGGPPMAPRLRTRARARLCRRKRRAASGYPPRPGLLR